jgi:hypothetical protein
MEEEDINLECVPVGLEERGIALRAPIFRAVLGGRDQGMDRGVQDHEVGAQGVEQEVLGSCREV